MTLLLALGTCRSEREPLLDTPEAVVERARVVHGARVLDRAHVSFEFRGDAYDVYRDGGRFTYQRTWADSLGRTVRDVLDNHGLRRTIDGAPASLGAAAGAAETTLNSVVYFALLPYNLADPAVRLRALEADTLRGEPYHVIEATFEQEGGGRDWEDRFVYWFHADHGTMDYLAYRFYTGEGGIRFREAYRGREVGGVRFFDYRNYSPPGGVERLEELGRLFEAQQLQLVSTVDLERLQVRAYRAFPGS